MACVVLGRVGVAVVGAEPMHNGYVSDDGHGSEPFATLQAWPPHSIGKLAGITNDGPFEQNWMIPVRISRAGNATAVRFGFI